MKFGIDYATEVATKMMHQLFEADYDAFIEAIEEVDMDNEILNFFGFKRNEDDEIEEESYE